MYQHLSFIYGIGIYFSAHKSFAKRGQTRMNILINAHSKFRYEIIIISGNRIRHQNHNVITFLFVLFLRLNNYIHCK